MTSFERTVVFSAPGNTAGCCQLRPPWETPGHSQVCLTQSPMGSLLHSPGSWCTQGFVCALQQSCFTRPVICNQIPLAFKVKAFKDWGFSVSLPDPQVGKSVVSPRTFAKV